MSSTSSQKFKVVLVGPSVAGKTSIITRLHSGVFTNNTEATIGSALISHVITTGDCNVTLHIWDTAGQELYKSLVPTYSRGAAAVISVFDVTSQNSYEEAKKWCITIRDDLPDALLYFVGNKCDLEVNVKITEAKKFIEKLGGKFLLTSAKDGTRINELFEDVGVSVYSNFGHAEPKTPFLEVNDDNERKTEKSECC